MRYYRWFIRLFIMYAVKNDLKIGRSFFYNGYIDTFNKEIKLICEK